MSGPLEIAAAILLVCAGKPVDPSLAADRQVGMVRLPMTAEMIAAFRQEPPLANISFSGEDGPKREWLLGGSPDAAGSINLIRLTKSGDPLSPFLFNGGKATRDDAGVWTFQPEASGKCWFQPTKQQSENSDK